MSELLSLSDQQQQSLSGIELVIFDIDNTLVFADDESFYDQYGAAVERAVAAHYGVDLSEAAQITADYRMRHGGGEQALFRGDVHISYPHIAEQPADTSILFDELCLIDPTGRFAQQAAMRAGVATLREDGIKTVALTSSPEPLSRRILAEAGFDPDQDFDAYVTYGRNELPPKMDSSRQIFAEIAEQFKVEHGHVLATGDSLRHDVLPAQELGMLACLIGPEVPDNFEGIVAASTLDLITALHTAAQTRQQGLPVSGDEVRWRL
jgi:FMN phosphatase YigB (HAD superfamily)